MLRNDAGKSKRSGICFLLGALGCVVSVLPPLIAVLLAFPLWLEGGSGKTLSGLALVLTGLCVIPFIRQIKEYMKSPSAVVIWLVICIFTMLVRQIIDEVAFISCVALISNGAGAVIYRIRSGFSEKGR